MKKIVSGMTHLKSLNITHRDLKLANLLLHFPNRPSLENLTPSMKCEFLKHVNLAKTDFEVKISDFGLSIIFDGTESS